MNSAPHSSLRIIMDEHVESAGGKPEDNVKHMRELTESILARTSTDVPDLFFSKTEVGKVGEGLSDFMTKKTDEVESTDTGIQSIAVKLSNRVYEAHHATVQAFRAAQQEGHEEHPARKAA